MGPDERKAHPRKPRKISIIGSGMVGASMAFGLVIERTASEIVLVDRNRDRAEGEARDLSHAVPFSTPTTILAGEYADCAGSDIIVITAGAAQRPGESRLTLVERNVAIFKEIVPAVMDAAPDAVILIVSNPVDVLTYVTLKLSGLPRQRVVGSGTVLDTARFRYELGAHFGVDPRNVHAYILGEHGDSEVPVWSRAMVAGVPVEDFCRMTQCGCSTEDREAMFQRVKTAAYEIINLKGATYYAIGLGGVRLIETILRDQHSIVAASTLLTGQYGISDVCFSLPVELGNSGVERVIEIPVDDTEREGLRRSAQVLRNALQQVGF